LHEYFSNIASAFPANDSIAGGQPDSSYSGILLRHRTDRGKFPGIWPNEGYREACRIHVRAWHACRFLPYLHSADHIPVRTGSQGNNLGSIPSSHFLIRKPHDNSVGDKEIKATAIEEMDRNWKRHGSLNSFGFYQNLHPPDLFHPHLSHSYTCARAHSSVIRNR